MSTDIRAITRRKLLRQSLLTGGVWLSGLHNWGSFGLPPDLWGDPRGDESFLGVVPFSGEGHPPLGEPIGRELDGRLFTDLSAVTPENRVIPTERFFIRTRASKLLDTAGWNIQVRGIVSNPVRIPVETLANKTRPLGSHLMECSGNTRMAHFGMLSVADWHGVPLHEIVETAKPRTSGVRVLVSGFDKYKNESSTSIPGASWIFSQDELLSSQAFVATKMNGVPLSADHGAPVRLLVPGWYGCVCIKWVNQIEFVAEDAPATSQMREYAGRTLQNGVPSAARDYQSARIGTAAMPVRIEKWRIGGKIRYRVAGILWGAGSNTDCEVQFSPEQEFFPVDRLDAAGDTWSFWHYQWTPTRTGEFTIRLRFKCESDDTRRLDSGYYDRSVKIAEI